MTFPKKSWAPDIHAKLVSLVSTKREGLACFDFDNTLIRNDFGEKMMEEVIGDSLRYVDLDLSDFFRESELWKNHSLVPQRDKERLVWEEYSYQLKEFGIERGYRWTAFLFEGLDREIFFEYSQKAWERVRGKVFPQPEMKDLIAYLYENHWTAYIVTASPEVGVQAIAPSFPIEEDKVIGMRHIQVSGKNTRQIREPYTYGEGKVRAIQERIGRVPDLAFGDSFNDYPMLCYSKQGIGIDRGNPEFVAACLSKGILVQPYFQLEA